MEVTVQKNRTINRSTERWGRNTCVSAVGESFLVVLIARSDNASIASDHTAARYDRNRLVRNMKSGFDWSVADALQVLQVTGSGRSICISCSERRYKLPPERFNQGIA